MKKIVCCLMMIVIVMGVFTGCGGSWEGKFEISNVSKETDRITGTIKNKTNNVHSEVRIVIEYTASSGEKWEGTSLGLDVGPNSTEEFMVPSSKDNKEKTFDTYKIKTVTYK